MSLNYNKTSRIITSKQVLTMMRSSQKSIGISNLIKIKEFKETNLQRSSCKEKKVERNFNN